MDHDAQRPPSSSLDPNISGERIPKEEVPDPSAGNGTTTSATEELKSAMTLLNEARDYAIYFVTAKLDGIKLTLRNLGIYAALGMIGAIAGATLVIVAVVQLCLGLAGALSALFGTGMWLGNVIVGLVILAALATGAWIGVSRFMNSSRERTVSDYEIRKRGQRAQYGHDVHQRAEEAKRSK